jgi:hypothetical protein
MVIYKIIKILLLIFLTFTFLQVGAFSGEIQKKDMTI